MATVISSLQQNTSGSDHLKRDVSLVLSKLDPDIYPLDTLLRRMKKGEPAQAVKVEFASVGVLPRTDTVKAEVQQGNAGAAVDVTVNNVGMWRVDDLILLVGIANSPVLWVKSVTPGTNTLNVHVLGATAFGTVPLLEKDLVIGWIGNAKEELGNASIGRMVQPDYDYNFCEISDAVVEISATRKATANYTKEHDWKRQRREQLVEFRKSLEYKSWFGKRSVIVDPTTGKPRWTMNGVTRYITKKGTYDKDIVNGPKITESQVIDWLLQAYAGNSGSTTRFLFADTYLAGELMKVDLVNLRSRKLEVVLGVKMDRMEFNFGTVYLKHHRGFNEMGHNHFGVLLDLEQISKRDLLPMEKNVLDYKAQGKHGEAEQYIEQSTLEIRYPDTHMLIVGD